MILRSFAGCDTGITAFYVPPVDANRWDEKLNFKL
jgi:hypothetical protein